MDGSPPFGTHASFSELAELYDGFILDQFGVLHNGTTALDGAVACVRELHRRGKKLIILSNSSSAATATLSKLATLGFCPELVPCCDTNQDDISASSKPQSQQPVFVGAVTSGEECSHYVRDTFDGQKALWITWSTPKTPSPCDFLHKCGNIVVANSVEDADFVLLHGAEVVRGPGVDGTAPETSLGSFPTTGDTSVIIGPLLQSCLERKLPMVCANPDFVMVKHDGTQGHMPGKISRLYEQMGGSCVSFGKPHVPHFEACLRDLGLPKDRVAHVGDSLHHDVAGANATGIASVFVVGGVHREELDAELGSLPSNVLLQELFATNGHTPTHVVPLLKM